MFGVAGAQHHSFGFKPAQFGRFQVAHHQTATAGHHRHVRVKLAQPGSDLSWCVLPDVDLLAPQFVRIGVGPRFHNGAHTNVRLGPGRTGPRVAFPTLAALCPAFPAFPLKKVPKK